MSVYINPAQGRKTLLLAGVIQMSSYQSGHRVTFHK